MNPLRTNSHATRSPWTLLRRPAVWVWLLLLISGLFGLVMPLRAQESPAAATGRQVYVLTFDGAITPVLGRYLEQGIEAALATDAQAVLLRLDTPGGNVSVTQQITQMMLAAPVPIVVYVAPPGANAGSAGTFVTLAGHVAAMAPQTSIGAASPVGGQGEDIGETMEAKVKNILSADIRNLADRRGEQATEWAVSAVESAAAATAEEALALGVIDFIATDVGDLVQQMDGFVVTVAGESRTLATGGAIQVPLEMDAVGRFLNFISDPTIASILLSLGILGLLAEIRTPGVGLPGVVGVISLLLAFYALGQLNANFVGLALVGLSIAFFIAEAFTPTFGLFAVAGIAAFVLGAFLLFNDSGYAVPWPAIITLAAGMGGFTIWAGAKAMAAQRRPVITGSEGLMNATAAVREGFTAGELGRVFIAGEWWNAQLVEGDSVPTGAQVTVVGRDGYTLQVVPRQ